MTGAHGLVGLNVVDHLASREGWEVVAAGRRPTPPRADVPYIPVDLADRDGAADALAACEDVSHLFFAAYQARAEPLDEVDVNMAMLVNTLDALEAAGAPIEHVTLYQGGKAYGAHLGPFRTPAKESDPRVMGPLFYYDQEDYVRARAADGAFGFTVLRPDHICGIGFGPFVNLLLAVGVYAAVCRELGLPLAFPGTDRAYGALLQATDAQLLARASEWAATAPSAANEIFNVTNGDLFRFRQLWPRIAAALDMPVGDPVDYPLARYMPDKADVWDTLVERHALDDVPYAELVNWAAADAIFGMEHDIHSSTVKIRQAGFHDCVDTEARFVDLLDELRRRKILPPA